MLGVTRNHLIRSKLLKYSPVRTLPLTTTFARTRASGTNIPCPGCVITTDLDWEPETPLYVPVTYTGSDSKIITPTSPSYLKWPQYAVDLAHTFVNSGYKHIHRWYYARMYFTSFASDQGRESAELYFLPGPKHPETPTPYKPRFPISPSPKDIPSLAGSTAVNIVTGKSPIQSDTITEHPSFPNENSVGSLAGLLHFGPYATGPPNSVHGGAIATAADVLMYRAVEYCGISGYTVNLNINYRNVIPIGHAIVMHVNVPDASSRKVVAEFGIFSPDHSVLYAEGSGIFVKPKEWSPTTTMETH